MEIQLPIAALRRLLAIAISLLVVLGLGVEVAHHVLGWEDPYDLVDYLSLSYEANLPTWAIVVLLFATGLLLALVAASRRFEKARFAGHWWALAITFFYISLDELVQLHESLGKLFALDGVLHFSWVVPAAVLLAVWVAAFVPFVRHLPESTRRRFLIAGGIYVLGALVLELPLGWWTDLHGNHNAGYALIDWAEETLELVGMSVFFYSLVQYVAAPGDRLRIVVGRPEPGPTAVRTPVAGEADAVALAGPRDGETGDLDSTASHRPSPAPIWLSVVFFLSGAAALVYQVVWQRSLFALYGLDVVSVTMVVSAFMLGLGAGSLVGGALSRRAPGAVIPLFGAFELGIGVFGFWSIRIFDAVGKATLGSGHLATGALAFLLVVVPTALMGATLPMLVGWAAVRSGNTGRSVGGLYFINTLGAAVGAWLAVKLFLPTFGLSGSVAVAGALNFGLGLAVITAVWLERRR